MRSCPPGRLGSQDHVVLLLWIVASPAQLRHSTNLRCDAQWEHSCACKCATWLRDAGCRKQAADDKLAEQQLVINHRKRRRTDREASGGGGGGADGGGAGDPAAQVGFTAASLPWFRVCLAVEAQSRRSPDGMACCQADSSVSASWLQRFMLCSHQRVCGCLFTACVVTPYTLSALSVMQFERQSLIAEGKDSTSAKHPVSSASLPGL